MIRSYIRYWPVVGGVIFVALALTLGIFADYIPALQRLMILFFMILTLHEFEEYVYPGGFPAANNIGLMGETKDFGKYPLNELSAFVVNVVLAYPLYICGIIFYEHLWLGIFIAYFTMIQCIIHCIVINRKLHSWYSPGCASALFVMLPFGIYYLTYLTEHFTFPGFYWWAPITVFPIVAVLMILSPILIFRNRNTKYGFSEYEATYFSVRKGIARLRMD